MAVITFATYSSLNNGMDPAIIFPAMMYLNLVRGPLNNITNVVSAVAQARKATAHLAEFLSASEKPSSSPDLSSPNSIIFRDAEWSITSSPAKGDDDSKPNSFVLSGFNFAIPRGKLVAIVGDVGSGKTCLLKALLRNMDLSQGSFDVNGTMAYCPREPWLLNGSVAENISFGQDLNVADIEKVIVAVGMDRDLSSMPDGINTKLGDAGSNLSGGQKSRIALARALYSERDIVLLDDPLSSLDASVSRHVFDQAIKKGLSEKTVLLATHQLQYLSETDMVLVLDKGVLVECGPFNELIDRNGKLTSMMASCKFLKIFTSR